MWADRCSFFQRTTARTVDELCNRFFPPPDVARINDTIDLAIFLCDSESVPTARNERSRCHGVTTSHRAMHGDLNLQTIRVTGAVRDDKLSQLARTHHSPLHPDRCHGETDGVLLDTQRLRASIGRTVSLQRHNPSLRSIPSTVSAFTRLRSRCSSVSIEIR